MTFADWIRLILDLATRFIAPLPVATEWLLVAIAAAAVAACAFRTGRWWVRLRSGFHTLANHRRLAILFCGFLPVAARLALLAVGAMPVPDPSIHDEFSHLLLADTLAHGRLTNPTHPMWEHFESIHIIQQPTYNSMYPPAHATFLALGQVVSGYPWAGVVISIGVMSAAFCWMLQGWMRPTWALFGALLAILKLGITGFWMNSYMGGAAPALGGALLIGSLPRLRAGQPRARNGFLLGLGLVILMNTRPFEGAVLGMAGLTYIGFGMLRSHPKHRRQMLRAAGWTAGMVVTLGVVLTGYYCWRVTGSPARLPYQVNRDTYGWPENLAFLPPKVLKLRHKALDDMYRKELDNRTRYTGATNIAANLGTRWFDSWTFLIGPALTVPLLLVPWMLRRPRTYPLAIFIGLIFVLNLFQMVLYPYHLGPVVPAAFALMAQGSRRIYLTVARKWRGRGMAFALALPAVLLLVGAMKQEAAVLRMPLAYWEIAAEGHRDARANIEDWLTARRRKQLVIVRYAPGHSPDQEWVYNHADIDSSKVVWAREMDPEEDEKLLRYFSDREVWLLRADEYPQRVVHYRLEPAGGFLPTCGGSQPSLLPAPQVTEPPHP